MLGKPMKLASNILGLILVLAGAAIGLLFYLDNQQPIAVNFIGKTIAELQLALWLIIFFGIGILFGWLISSAQAIKYRFQLKHANKQSQRLQNNSVALTTLDEVRLKS